MSEFRFEGSKVYFDYAGVGEKNNETLMGEFCVKCTLSPIDHINADRLYRELIGSTNPHLAEQSAKNYAFALSQLQYRLLKSAPFFKNADGIDGGHLPSNILIDIINLAIEAEEEYGKQQDKKVEEMQKMLADRIKNKQIKPEEEAEDPIEADEEEIPEIDLGD